MASSSSSRSQRAGRSTDLDRRAVIKASERQTEPEEVRVSPGDDRNGQCRCDAVVGVDS